MAGNKKGKAYRQQKAAISEAFRIKVSHDLQQFKESNDLVYTFDANLTNHERAVVHQVSRKMGLVSRSSGKGDQRRVTVSRKEQKSTLDVKKEEEKKFSSLSFSEESKRVLVDLFTHYPPHEFEMVRQTFNDVTRISHKSGHKRDDFFWKPVMTKDEIAKKVDSLACKVATTPNLKSISEKRFKLPIASFKDVITSTITNHQVVLIAGETGCGKTTQVPQYLLDNMWTRRKVCKIVCTQPRRISAMSVAERISQERGEHIGETVGYKIRLDSKGGRHSSILFCTNGILLRMLVSRGANESQSRASSMRTDTNISEITHIIVDEIHERDRYSDFMLAVLRDLLPTYPHLRLVLMSATLDAERFSQYFGGCPIIRVPGFTHPVKTFYLEDVLSILKTRTKNHLSAPSSSYPSEELLLNKDYRSTLDEAIEMASSYDEYDPLELISSEGTPEVLNYQHSSTGVTPLMVFAGKGRVGDVCKLLGLGADCHLKASDGSTALDWAMRGNQNEVVEVLLKHAETNLSRMEEKDLLDKYMSNINPEFVDVILIERLLTRICEESTEGAILVFVPGWEDINKIRERLIANPFFNDSSKFLILSLHSMVPAVEQIQVFKKPPAGCRKIVLSTNIAETAVTIDDVVFVVDSGRMKEKSYDPYNNVSTLQSSWVSQASAKQREGRAGRCQPGVCYHLYSKIRSVSLAEFQVPEIMRIPVEELCLQVKMIDPNCKIEEFLKKTLDPPILESTKNAIAVLQDIGALSHDERLTELGEKLGSLPVHPLTSKMLFFAILLNCLDPALTFASAADFKDPFTLPKLPYEKERAAAAKAKFASFYGGFSDQLAVIAAFDCWRSAKQRGQERQFCSQYFISSSTMSMIDGMRQQLVNELISGGFILDVSSCSMNARDPGIVRAVLVAALYPMVGRLTPKCGGKRLFVETTSSKNVKLHPHSLISKVPIKIAEERSLLVYDEVTRSDSGLNTRNCTLMGPLPLALVATEMVVVPGKDDDGDGKGSQSECDKEGSDVEMETLEKPSKQGERIMSSPDNSVIVVVDRWLSFKSTAFDVAQIYCLRERLSDAIHFKVTNPRGILPPVLGASVYAIACLLSYDGLKGVSLPMESVDTLTSMINATNIGNLSEKTNEAAEADSYLASLFTRSTDSLKNIPHGNNLGSQVVWMSQPVQAMPMYAQRFIPAPARPWPRRDLSKRRRGK